MLKLRILIISKFEKIQNWGIMQSVPSRSETLRNIFSDMIVVENPSDPRNYPSPIVIRHVWADNLEYEFMLIRHSIHKYCNISMDTEFPGVYFRLIDVDERYTKRVSSETHYSLLKQNVDALKIIQVGLTLTDSEGNLPDLGSKKYRFIWQFNFKDFDVTRDHHAPDSVELLRQNGLDFDRNQKFGVDSVRFGELVMSSGLVCNDSVTWVTFHCAYDFGYLVKILTQRVLPSELSEFLSLVRVFFGERVYDVKHMIKFCNGLYGGLDQVASTLQQDREVGCSHQSGSDSLLTWRVFQKIRDVYFSKDGSDIAECSGLLYGLEISFP